MTVRTDMARGVFMETDTGLEYTCDGSSWRQSAANGATHVTLRDSLMGPEGAAAGEVLTVAASTGADDVSAAITAGAIDVYIPAAFTGGVRIEIGSGPTTSANRVYGPGTYRWPITSGNKIAVRSNDATTGSVYVNPVA